MFCKAQFPGHSLSTLPTRHILLVLLPNLVLLKHIGPPLPAPTTGKAHARCGAQGATQGAKGALAVGSGAFGCVHCFLGGDLPNGGGVPSGCFSLQHSKMPRLREIAGLQSPQPGAHRQQSSTSSTDQGHDMLSRDRNANYGPKLGCGPLPGREPERTTPKARQGLPALISARGRLS